jgi:hypothetical protein
MAESWLEVVKRVFKENKAKNPNYKLKHAMKTAKKIYKKQTASDNNITSNRKTTSKSSRVPRKENRATRKRR